MAMRSFLVFMMILFVGVTQAFLFFKGHFSGAEAYKEQVHLLSEQLQQEKTKSYAVLFEAERMRQEVATLLPNRTQDTSSYEVRKLASALQASEGFEVRKPSRLLQDGKSHFSKGDYNRAILTFRKLIERFPESPETIEAYFLTVEALFQIQSTEDCIDTVEQMVALFPESELTGFAMLRVATVFKERKMEDDAVQVVQTVKEHFGYHQELREQSDRLLKDLKR